MIIVSLTIWMEHYANPSLANRVSYFMDVGQQRTVTLTDGTTVDLNSDTWMYVDFDGDARKISLSFRQKSKTMQSDNSFLKGESVCEKVPYIESMQIFAELGEPPIWEAFIDAIAGELESYGITHFRLTVINSPFGEQISTLPNEAGTVLYLVDVAREHFLQSYAPLFLSDIENHIVSYPFRSPRIIDFRFYNTVELTQRVNG